MHQYLSLGLMLSAPASQLPSDCISGNNTCTGQLMLMRLACLKNYAALVACCLTWDTCLAGRCHSCTCMSPFAAPAIPLGQGHAMELWLPPHTQHMLSRLCWRNCGVPCDVWAPALPAVSAEVKAYRSIRGCILMPYLLQMLSL